MLRSYKQRHLKRGELYKKILPLVESPKSNKDLSKFFGKSKSRIWRALSKLEKEGLVKEFRVGSLSYWVSTSSNTVIISRTKNKILDFLDQPRRVHEIAKHLKAGWKSPFRRLKELERLKLVKQKGNLWYKLPIKKEVMVL